jgi:hypothetical protein
VIVTSVRWETIAIKSGTGRKAKTKSETALEIDFSGLVAGAGDLAAYQLSSVTTKKIRKKSVATYKPIKLTSAVPVSSPTTSSVALFPASKPNLSQTGRLEITAADLTDAFGRPIDGNGDGQPGGDIAATLNRQGVGFAQPGIPLDRADGVPVPSDPGASKIEIIDALLERGDLARRATPLPR